MILLIALCIGVAPCFAEATAAPAPAAVVLAPTTAGFDLERDREPVISLDGLWRFHPGDDPDMSKGWASPTFDDSSWSLLRSDRSWSEQGYPGMSGFGWYRFDVTQAAGDGPVAMMLAPILTSYEVYVDGKLVGTAGKMPPAIAPFGMFQFHEFPLADGTTLAQHPSARTIHVALRVWHSEIWAGYIGGGPSQSGSLAGSTSMIHAEMTHRRNLQRFIFVDSYSYSIVATLVGLTIFGLFCFRPREREYLWFAILLISAAMDQAFTIIYNVYAFLPVPLYDLFDSSLTALNQVAGLAFFSIVLRARRDRIWTACLALALVSPIFNVLYWPGWLSVPTSAALSLLCVLPSSLWVLAILLRRAFDRDPDATLLTIPTVLYHGVFFLLNTAILLSQGGWAKIPDILLEPLPLPPFTMHWQILVDLVFLIALLAFLIRRFTMARQGEERYTGQLEAARQVQQVLLPEAIPQVSSFAVDCIYRPAEVVGGDFFQILHSSEGDLLIVVGDVAGKGIAAAMMVSVLVGAIRAEVEHTSDPVNLLSSLNDRMHGRSESGVTTCLCARLTVDGEFSMASAGHLPPYLNGRELTTPGAFPLGVIPDQTYERVALQCMPGDRLTFVSDGVVEAQNKFGELLGFERTQAMSMLQAAEIADAASLFGQIDDITVVTIEFRGNGFEAFSPIGIRVTEA